MTYPDPVPAEELGDRGHLRLLTTLHWLWAGLSGLCCCGGGAGLVVFGIAVPGILEKAARPGQSPPPAELGRFASVIYLAEGGVALVAGIVYVILGVLTARFLAARRNRTFCVVAAAIECMAFPVGTALGVWTLVVLCRPAVAESFDRARPGA